MRAVDKGDPSLSCAPETTGCTVSDPQPVGYIGEACALISALQASAEDGDAAWEPTHPHRRRGEEGFKGIGKFTAVSPGKPGLQETQMRGEEGL